jgi:uncharacterized protein YndB with AHSA1/START domain
MTVEVGELVEAGERWELRYERRLAHSPEKVWRAITEAEHLKIWFPQQIIGEFVVGSELTFKAHGSDDPGFAGTVTAVDPPRLLAFTWGADQITIEIAAEGDGSLLTFVDSITELGKAARDGAGWHACLDALELVVAGTGPDWEGSERWAAVHPSYVSAFGLQAATIGPPTSK